MNRYRRSVRTLAVILTPVVILATLLAGSGPSHVGASSHREAPLIAMDPYADNTDLYAFISPDRPDSVTIIANYIPLEWPEAGPNFFEFDDDVLYEIHVDNVGDAKSHITYQFRFETRPTDDAGTTFLYNDGPIESLNDPNWKVPQFYSVTQLTDGGSPDELANDLATPPVYVGEKSTPDYEALADMAIHSIGSGEQAIKVFAGQRDDAFFVDLGAAFDLLSLRGQAPPIGYEDEDINTPLDGVAGYNTHTIAIQVPISQLTQYEAEEQGVESVIGVWATASRRSMRVINDLSTMLATGEAETHSGDFVQVSRLGMPLTNEVVIPRALKDAFNKLMPEQDAGLYTGGTPEGNLLMKSVLDPELQRLLQALYGVPNPGTNRLDIQEIFLTGMRTNAEFTIQTADGPVTLPPDTNVNQPSDVQPAEMLRLNTAPAFRPGTPGNICDPSPNYELGLLGGDACGFPNGRRLQDDVTDIELLAVAGAAYEVLTGDDSFDFNEDLIGVLRDGLTTNDKEFLDTFPYIATPWSGTEHNHADDEGTGDAPGKPTEQVGAYRSFLPFLVHGEPQRLRNGVQE